MPQHFRLDHLGRLSYLCVLAACVRSAPAPAPQNLPPVSAAEAARWASASAPSGHRLNRFRWLFNDGQASVGGRGSARLAGPDSMRFDIAGPLGLGGAAAMVVGDQAQWVHPPDVIARLIPSYPLMWAMFGVIRPPPRGARSRGTRSEGNTLLQWANGADTVRYSHRAASPGTLRAEWQRGGVTMGIVETRLDADGAPVSARLTVPSVPARLDITIVVDSIALAFPRSVWTPPAP